MTPPKVISLEFLLWAQALALWSVAAYGVAVDPMRGEIPSFLWTRWMVGVFSRAVVAALFGYIVARSTLLSSLLLLTILLQSLLRICVPVSWLAEFESFSMAAYMLCSLEVIRSCHLTTRWVPAAIYPARLAALCILAGTLFLVVRGGTYIVRGVLGKSVASPSQIGLDVAPAAPAISETSTPVTTIAASVEQLPNPTVDVKEYNRGRLIGNLERIVLTIVVAAGSYAALAFLVAAKGVVRSDEFDENRDFAEYFLIGSLASVLVALCAGIALRFALIRLWPDLLSLQIE
jgi:hypothetical protein